MSNILKYTLPNGVRVLVEPVSHVQSAAIGLWCRTGSRHELEHEAGITHLIEHMLFKGTPTRTARQIPEEIEGRGGSLNAFTDKESTCYYARMLAEDTDVAIDVLSDMVLNTLLDEEELEREEQVVVEEIKRSIDEPGDHVHDLHLQHRWGQHALGKGVIGTIDSVTSFKPDDLRGYMSRRYRGDNIVLSVTGNVDDTAIVEQAAKIFRDVLPGGEAERPSRPAPNVGANYIGKDSEQIHFCIGTDGVGIYDREDIYVLSVLDAALGGSMSSRLFQEIREKRGLVYSVGSYSLMYSSGGAHTVYGGCSPKHWPLVQTLVKQEYEKLMAGGLEPEELIRTKKNITGHMVLGLESMSSRMMRMSRNEINHQRDVPIDETLQAVNAVTNEQIITLAKKMFQPENISITVIGPEEKA